MVVAEPTQHGARGLQSTAAQIRRAVLAEHQIALHDLVFVEAGTLPRTSSGKVMRRRTRELYLAKQLIPAGSTTPLQRLWKKAAGRVSAIIYRLTSRG